MAAPDNIPALKRLFKQKSLLEIAIQVEKFLDSMNVFVYPNWFDGELVVGPNLQRYWVTVSFKYDYEKMPDPRAAKILAKVGVRCKYIKETEQVPVEVKTQADYRPGINKPKLENKDVWLVELKIPRRFLDEDSLDDLETIDDEVDVDDIGDAVDDGLTLDSGFKS